MKFATGPCMCAVLMAAMMLMPVIPGLGEDARAPPAIVRSITTLGDGTSEKTLTFSNAGANSDLYLTIPNGATVLSAKINLTGLPASPGGKDCPENVTLDVGDDGTPEYAFKGKGYGLMGEQTLLANATNSSTSYKVPFFQGGTNETIKIRLPKTAKVTRAGLNLLGSHGSGPDSINYVTQMQSWAPNNWVTSGYQIMVNSLNGQILYDNIQFDLSGIPDTCFVSSGVFWWGRQGSSYYGYSGYSFADQLGAYRLEQQWNVGTQNMVKESPAESFNMMTVANTFYSWDITKMMGSWAVGEHANYGLCIHRTQAAIQDKWDYSLRPYVDLKYGTPANVTVKLKGADTNMFYRSGPFDNSAYVDDFSAMLNKYLSTHDATLTDAYGNAFVDVPLSVTSTDPGSINISDLDVAYDYCATAGPNPETDDLAGALNALVNPAADGGTTDIKLSVSTNSTGKVKVSGIRIDYRPPDHYATIDSRFPEDDVVVMNENTTVNFNITASDLYDFPLNITWLIDNAVALKRYSNFSWYADFDANGTYTVAATVDNLLHKTTTSWTLIVKNVNRKPVIDSSAPENRYTMDENSSKVFDVSASDPDGDPMTYAWYLDGRTVGTGDPSYEYRTDYFSAGAHTIKVAIRDSLGANAYNNWTVTVTEVNAEPIITDASPAGDDAVMNENDSRKFTVSDLSIDGDRLSELWYVDGIKTGQTGKTFNFTTDYNDSGVHTVEVEVTDGKAPVRRSWQVTVFDVNRPPLAVIKAPAPGSEFLTWDAIRLDASSCYDPDGDALNLSWSDGKKSLGTGAVVTAHLSKGKHLVNLTVNDGRKNGVSTGQVELTIRYIEFDALLTTDKEKPMECKTLKFSVQLTNRGDGSFDEIPVTFRVDGVNQTAQSIQSIEPDRDFTLEFTWNAVRGEHKLEIVVLNQNFSKIVTVAKKPVTGQQMASILPLIGITVVVAVAAAGAFFAIKRKRQAPAPQGQMAQGPQYAPMQPPAQYVPMQPPAPYMPMQSQAAPLQPPMGQAQGPPPAPACSAMAQAPPPGVVPPQPMTSSTSPAAEQTRPQADQQASPVPAPPTEPSPPAPPAAGAVAAAAGPPAVEDPALAQEAMKNLEDVLQQADKLGIDTARAREIFNVARNFYDMGRYSKAVQYCKKAEGYID